jgi:hypothetical protein
MNARLTVICVRTILGTAAAAYALFAADASAKDHNVTVAIHVSAQGCDPVRQCAAAHASLSCNTYASGSGGPRDRRACADSSELTAAVARPGPGYGR